MLDIADRTDRAWLKYTGPREEVPVPTKGWKTFIQDHATGIQRLGSVRSADNLVPSALGLLIMGQADDRVYGFGSNDASGERKEWIANQITELGWERSPAILTATAMEVLW